MSSAALRYIVYAASWSEMSGGAIFQHGLVRALRDLGQDAWLWPMKSIYRPNLVTRIREELRLRPFHTAPGLEDAVARKRHLNARTVAVYGESILGNPLKAPHVARWLLYRPGLRHPYEFGKDDMFFRVGEITDLPEITGGAPDLTLWSRNRVYSDEGRPDRKGVCYMVRKGDDKARWPETETADAICLDGKSHAEVAEVFNRSETFISYDEATMYSQYAALCGCDSIVVPGIYDSPWAWRAQHEMAQFGVAYGREDLPHARATRDQVLPMLEAREAASLETVKRFVELTRARFGA